MNSVIVGLRAYSSKANILPEQTLGRGLRRMYFGSDQRETVAVLGTPAFMDFVESIQSEGVTFERVPMGGSEGRERQDSIVVEVDSENSTKDLDALDIAIPRLTRRFNREFKDLGELDVSTFGNVPNAADYSGRGIGIDDPRWLTFENFRLDMGEKPAGLSLERRDNSRGYSRLNCAWASVVEQNRNRRSVKLTMERAAEIRSLAGSVGRNELARRYGVSRRTVYDVVDGRTWREAA